MHPSGHHAIDYPEAVALTALSCLPINGPWLRAVVLSSQPSTGKCNTAFCRTTPRPCSRTTHRTLDSPQSASMEPGQMRLRPTNR
jgi:hypothetical protein